MRFVATWLRVALFCLVKTNRRSHSVKENANADFRLFAITFIAYCACACG